MAVPSIVVTDQDPVYLELIQEVFTWEGYPGICCVPIADAWDCIARAEPSLVCLEIALHDPENGWGLFDRIRRYAPTVAIPVILCATNARLLTDEAAYLQGLNCHILEKRFPFDELLALVRQLIGPPPERERTM